jgi:hypothetical protein
LIAALEELIRQPIPVKETDAAEDFGEDLIQGGGDEPVRVRLLAADCAARGAHDLAGRIFRNEAPRGHLDLAVPLAPTTTPGTRTFRVFSADQDQ